MPFNWLTVDRGGSGLDDGCWNSRRHLKLTRNRVINTGLVQAGKLRLNELATDIAGFSGE